MIDINYKIYGLIEKNTSEIKYIGLTTNTLKDRLRRHLHDKKIDHKTNWIKKVGIENIEIILIEDGIKDRKILCDREIFYIDKYKKEGHKLTNLTNGGDGLRNLVFSKEHKEKLSKNHADVSGEKNPMYGKTHTDEVKELFRKRCLDREITIDTRRKMSDNNKGEKNSNALLTENDVLLIREYFSSGKYKKIKLAEMFNVKGPAIYKIIKRLTWNHI